MPTSEGLSLEGAIREVRRLESAGDFLEAHERAMVAHARWPDDVTLRFRAVLTLARAGTIDDALALYDELKLVEIASEDERALKGRLLKDRALMRRGASRQADLRAAAAFYAEAHAFGGGAFSAINAATLLFLAGDEPKARVWRQRATAACTMASVATSLDRYWRDATLAEAALLAGDDAAAARALQQATAPPRDVAAWASTRRQLALICEARGRDESILDPLRLPSAIHYLGHMIAPPREPGRFPAALEPQVAEAIRARLDRHDAGFLCGSLACGADILFAEAALERKAELHVVMPFAREDFVRLSVARGGAGWVDRFDACLGRATSVTWATDANHDGDDSLFTYASRIAMGQAALIARRIGGVLRQVAVWDGQPASGLAGTAIDIANWPKFAEPTDVIAVPARWDVTETAFIPRAAGAGRRVIRAILFGDIKGFSRLRDDQVPRFERHILHAVADAVAPYDATLRYRNTWGDGLFLAFDDPHDAAAAALAIQAGVSAAARDAAAAGLPPDLQLRLAGHLGPTYDGFDPLRRERSVIGAHVTRAARLEPVTPSGAIFITEPFAAALALAPRAGIATIYVGRRPMAKDYGELRLYRLDRQGASG